MNDVMNRTPEDHYAKQQRDVNKASQMLTWAANANLRARELEAGLRDLPDVSIWFLVESNMLFLTLPEAMARRLESAGCIFYTWGAADGAVSARLVASFNTSEEDVRHFLQAAGSAC